MTEAERVHHAGTEVLDQNVAAPDERDREIAAALGLQVDRDVSLAAVLLHVVAAHAAAARPQAAREIAVGRLDLDHVGAEIAEHARAKRPGQHAAEVGDADAVERLRGCGIVGHAAMVAMRAAEASRAATCARVAVCGSLPADEAVGCGDLNAGRDVALVRVDGREADDLRAVGFEGQDLVTSNARAGREPPLNASANARKPTGSIIEDAGKLRRNTFTEPLNVGTCWVHSRRGSAMAVTISSRPSVLRSPAAAFTPPTKFAETWNWCRRRYAAWRRASPPPSVCSKRARLLIEMRDSYVSRLPGGPPSSIPSGSFAVTLSRPPSCSRRELRAVTRRLRTGATRRAETRDSLRRRRRRTLRRCPSRRRRTSAAGTSGGRCSACRHCRRCRPPDRRCPERSPCCSDTGIPQPVP